MCGILHDLGKIVMAHIMPEVFEMVIKVAQHEKNFFFLNLKIFCRQLDTNNLENII